MNMNESIGNVSLSISQFEILYSSSGLVRKTAPVYFSCAVATFVTIWLILVLSTAMVAKLAITRVSQLVVEPRLPF